MNTYKIFEICRWDDEHEVKTRTFEASDLSNATINIMNKIWSEDPVETMDEIAENVFGNVTELDCGDSCYIELDEGNELLIVKIS